MKKQLTAILTSALLLCSLTACKDSAGGGQGDNSSQNDVSQCSSDLSNNSNDTSYDTYVNNYVEPVQTAKIDNSLDCGKIVLDSADALKNMVGGYYNNDTDKLLFKTEKNSNGGFDFAKIVVSENFNSYSDFKKLFDNSIYEKYIDLINYSGNGFREKDGVLYYSDYVNGGNRGTAETWCVGYDVEESRIIGHFAELKVDIASPETVTADFLNDKNNYRFYDIIIQNIDGNYVVTNCVDSENNQCFSEHGLCYNSGFADRSLVTNPEVLPMD